MTEKGYDPRFAAATTAAGGTVGIIIPPSIIFIVYGFLLDLPISDLFIGGMLPGILMVLAMQTACYLVSRKNGYGHVLKFEPKVIAKNGLRAYLGFIAIGIVIRYLLGQVFSYRSRWCNRWFLPDCRDADYM